MKSLRVTCVLVSILGAVACGGGSPPTHSADVAATPTPDPCQGNIPQERTITIEPDGNDYCKLDPAMPADGYEATPCQAWNFTNNLKIAVTIKTNAKVTRTTPSGSVDVYLFCDDRASCKETGRAQGKKIESGESLLVWVSSLAEYPNVFDEPNLFDCTARPSEDRPRVQTGARFKIQNPTPLESRAE